MTTTTADILRKDLAALEAGATIRRERIAEWELQIATSKVELAAIEGQMTGIRRAMELFVDESSAAEQNSASNRRYPVERVVLAALRDRPLTEAEIATRSVDIPEARLHDGLLRMLRSDKIEATHDGRYRLPAAPTQQDAAE